MPATEAKCAPDTPQPDANDPSLSKSVSEAVDEDEGALAGEVEEDEEPDEASTSSVSEAQSSDERDNTPPPPIQLPDRATRGRRLRQELDEEEENADNEFWQQEFFAEEGADDDYATESSSDDEPDSDFDKSESEDDDEEEADNEKVRGMFKTQKAKDKPPGHKQAALRRARIKRAREAKAAPKSDTGEAADTAAGAAGTKRRRTVEPAEPASAPVLRNSTYRKVLDDASKRKAEQRRSAPAKKEKPDAPPQTLTMVEVLKRAAADQLANEASLQWLIAREEESKAKASLTRERNTGPSVKWKSDCVCNSDGVATERSYLSFPNMTVESFPDLYRPHMLMPPRPNPHVVIDSSGAARQRVRRGASSVTAPSAPDASSWLGDPHSMPWFDRAPVARAAAAPDALAGSHPQQVSHLYHMGNEHQAAMVAAAAAAMPSCMTGVTSAATSAMAPAAATPPLGSAAPAASASVDASTPGGPKRKGNGAKATGKRSDKRPQGEAGAGAKGTKRARKGGAASGQQRASLPAGATSSAVEQSRQRLIALDVLNWHPGTGAGRPGGGGPLPEHAQYGAPPSAHADVNATLHALAQGHLAAKAGGNGWLNGWAAQHVPQQGPGVDAGALSHDGPRNGVISRIRDGHQSGS